jgi:hypothetical protein
MICECEKIKKGPFATEKNYLDCQKKVNQMISEGVLEKTGEIEPNGPFISTGVTCLMCTKKWTLNSPDQAYRGGWFEN